MKSLKKQKPMKVSREEADVITLRVSRRLRRYVKTKAPAFMFVGEANLLLVLFKDAADRDVREAKRQLAALLKRAGSRKARSR